MTLSGVAAAWGGPNRTGVNPDPQAWAAFVKAVVHRFKGRVHRYAMWNEPNLGNEVGNGGFLTVPKGKSRPALYRQLYRIGALLTKLEDPKAQVIFGLVFCLSAHSMMLSGVA